jgi:alanyl-tRNA synthetase
MGSALLGGLGFPRYARDFGKNMTTVRLYYRDSFLYDFQARVLESAERGGKNLVVLDRTAFYPTSGGQVHDVGILAFGEGRASRILVLDVAEGEDGSIYHFTSHPVVPEGTNVYASIDAPRRHDHMQQHTGQHILSAAFVRLFDIPTVSFHMGAESCTIDLETNSLSAAQVEAAERLANEIITEDRPVRIRFAALERARKLGVRKLPPKQSGELRLIDITDFDLTACGGTHARSTGQIGSILLRKVEKVKQGVRVEFVCGRRAVKTAHKDYAALTEAAGLYSAHIHDVPQQIQKSLEEAKAAGKAQHKLLEELAELQAEKLLAGNHSSPRTVIALFPERDAVFIKLLALKLTAGKPDVVALLASGAGQLTLVFAQSPGQKTNMGQLMKEVMSQLGGRGGGAADLAQGGLAGSFDLARIKSVLQEVASRL